MDKTTFCHPELGHENDTCFYNQQPRSSARGSPKELLRWLVTRESYTWNVDIQNEYDASMLIHQLLYHKTVLMRI
ncbi:hypothetical protein ABVN80_04025 [Acinetobacter baumannii]